MSPPDPLEPAHEGTGSPFFAAWGRAVLRFRLLILALIVAATGFMGYSAATRLVLDNSVEAFTASDSRAHAVLEQLRDQFGRDDLFLVLVEGDVFSLPYLERLRALHDELAGLDLELKTLGERRSDRERKRAELRGDLAPAVATPAPTAAPGDEPATAQVDDQAFEAPSFEDDAFAPPDFDDGDATAGAADAWGDEAGGSIVDEITSLVNVRRTRATADGIAVGKLLDPWPAAEALPALRDEVLGDATLVGQVVGKAGRHSVLAIRTQFMSEADSAKVYQAVVAIGAKHASDDFRVSVSGLPAMNASLNALMLSDLQRMMGIALGAMFLLLVILFRHPLGVVGPAAVVVVAAVWTFGSMALLGWSMTMLSNILPAFLICVGLGDSIHLQSVYRDARRRGVANHDAIVHAVATTGLPILFTTMTTMVGLLSFRFATTTAIGEMGTMGAWGVFVAFLWSVVLLPIALSFNARSLLGAREAGAPDLIDGFLELCVRLSGTRSLRGGEAGSPEVARRKRRLVLLVAFAIGGVAIMGASTLRVFHNPMNWIPIDDPARVAFDEVDTHLGGTSSVQLFIEAGGERGVKDLELLRGLEQLQAHVLAYRDPESGDAVIANATGLLDIVKETHQALHGGAASEYRLPDTQQGVSDAFFMFENASPSQLKRLASTDLKRAQVTFRVKWLEATAYGPLTAYVNEGVARFIPDGAKAQVQITGSAYTLFEVVSALIGDLIKSFGTAFLLISAMMILLLRDLKLGLVSMVPNLLPIATILGLMGFAGIPIDMGNLLIASIAIGIAVDDTIHFLHHYREHYRAHGVVDDAIRYSMNHSGRALVSTSAVLVVGFFVYLAANMYSLQRFGMLIGLTVIFALIFDLVFAPALLRTVFKDRPRAAPGADTPTAKTGAPDVAGSPQAA